jgi:hypothetical protein
MFKYAFTRYTAIGWIAMLIGMVMFLWGPAMEAVKDHEAEQHRKFLEQGQRELEHRIKDLPRFNNAPVRPD